METQCGGRGDWKIVDIPGDSLEVGDAELDVLVGHPGIDTGWARDRAFKPRVACEGLQMDEVAQGDTMES